MPIRGILTVFQQSEDRRPLFLVTDTSDVAAASFSSLFSKTEVTIQDLPAVNSREIVSIERIAAIYLDTIRKTQQHGPYRLAGRFVGGAVAYEIACQLIGADEVVEFLTLIDLPRRKNNPGEIGESNDAIDHYCFQPLPIPLHLITTADSDGGDRLSEWGNSPVGGNSSLESDGESNRAVTLFCDQEQVPSAIARIIAMRDKERSSIEGPASAMPIQLGRKKTAPIFCVPGAGANITSYMQLTEALGSEATIYGLQPRGMDGKFVPHTSVVAAAKKYVEAVKGIAPKGPYRLLGHSFGGWVVFEMACQLTSQGEYVEPVLLLDTRSPTERVGLRTRAGMLMKLVRVLEEANERSLDLTRREIEALGYEEQQIRLLECLKSAGILPHATRLEAIQGLVRVFSTNLNTPYVPMNRLAAQVVLIQAGEPSRYRDDDDDDDAKASSEHWRKHAAHVAQVTVPGNHMTMLKEPNVSSIAACIREFWNELPPRVYI